MKIDLIKSRSVWSSCKWDPNCTSGDWWLEFGFCSTKQETVLPSVPCVPAVEVDKFSPFWRVFLFLHSSHLYVDFHFQYSKNFIFWLTASLIWFHSVRRPLIQVLTLKSSLSFDSHNFWSLEPSIFFNYCSQSNFLWNKMSHGFWWIWCLSFNYTQRELLHSKRIGEHDCRTTIEKKTGLQESRPVLRISGSSLSASTWGDWLMAWDALMFSSFAFHAVLTFVRFLSAEVVCGTTGSVDIFFHWRKQLLWCAGAFGVVLLIVYQLDDKALQARFIVLFKSRAKNSPHSSSSLGHLHNYIHLKQGEFVRKNSPYFKWM